MQNGKNYLRVYRIRPTDFHLRIRADVSDQKRFRPGEAVAVCADCRGISRLKNWRAHDNTCPLCGSRQTVRYRSFGTSAEKKPLIHTHPALLSGWNSRLVLFILAVFIFVLIMEIRSTDKAEDFGFYLRADGKIGYQENGTDPYKDGYYVIDGTVYQFRDFCVLGPCCVFLDKGGGHYRNADGDPESGWHSIGQSFIKTNENGKLEQVIEWMDIDGFITLEGLGTFYIDPDGKPASGWRSIQNHLYRFDNGTASAAEDMPGTFAENGQYLPEKCGFVDTGFGQVYLNAQGEIPEKGTPVLYKGLVYQLDEEGRIDETVYVSENEDSVYRTAETAYIVCDNAAVILESGTGRAMTGWILYNGYFYFADNTGRLWTDCSSPQYSGILDQTGIFRPEDWTRLTLDGVMYDAAPDGSVLRESRKVNGYLVIHDADGRVRTDGSISHVGMIDENGILRPYISGVFEVEGEYYCLESDGSPAGGWICLGHKMYYFDPDTGRRAADGVLADKNVYPLSEGGWFQPAERGIYSFGEDLYCLDTDGTVQTGWQPVGTRYLYFDEQTGKQVTAMNTDDQPGTEPLPEDSGESVMEPVPEPGWHFESGTRFYILEDGSMASGWLPDSDHLFYLDPENRRVVTGMHEIDGRSYYFREDGALAVDDPVCIRMDGKLYRIGREGIPEGGVLLEDGFLYRFDPETAQLCWTTPENCDAWVSVYGGYLLPAHKGILELDGNRYYLEADGHVRTGWFIEDGDVYCADPSDGRLRTQGRSENPAGSFKDGKWSPDNGDSVIDINGSSYVFRNGRIMTGLLRVDRHLVYADPVTLRIQKNGTATVAGRSFAVQTDGKCVPGEICLVACEGMYILLGEDGEIPGQGGVQIVDEHIVIPDEDGVIRADPPGLPEGARISNGTVVPEKAGITEIEGNTWWLEEDGRISKGTRVWNGRIYCFTGTDGCLQTETYTPGILEIGNDRYYVRDETGAVGIGWIYLENFTLYADNEGRLQKGIAEIGPDLYCFDDDCLLITEHWSIVEDSSGNTQMIYSDESGKLLTGWQEIEHGECFFDENGYMQKNTIIGGKYLNNYGLYTGN